MYLEQTESLRITFCTDYKSAMVSLRKTHEFVSAGKHTRGFLANRHGKTVKLGLPPSSPNPRSWKRRQHWHSARMQERYGGMQKEQGSYEDGRPSSGGG